MAEHNNQNVSTCLYPKSTEGNRAWITVNSTSTSGPGWDCEGDVVLREEQQDGGGHGTKCKSVGPTVTEAAYRIQRPGRQWWHSAKKTFKGTKWCFMAHFSSYCTEFEWRGYSLLTPQWQSVPSGRAVCYQCPVAWLFSGGMRAPLW